MLLGTLTVIIMLAVAYAYLREGVFTACTMFVNVFLSCLVAVNFWEPLADLLGPVLANSFVRNYEDFVCLLVLFCMTLGLLRTATNYLAHTQISFPPLVQRGGGVLFGLLTGYLVTGFLVFALQTLPWHENFMKFDPNFEPGPEHTVRRVLPPDRTFLALMYRAGAFAFANEEDNRSGGSDSSSYYDRYYTFDKSGTFEMRYRYYRRYGDGREAKPYQHELDAELHGPHHW